MLFCFFCVFRYWNIFIKPEQIELLYFIWDIACWLLYLVILRIFFPQAVRTEPDDDRHGKAAWREPFYRRLKTATEITGRRRTSAVLMTEFRPGDWKSVVQLSKNGHGVHISVIYKHHGWPDKPQPARISGFFVPPWIRLNPDSSFRCGLVALRSAHRPAGHCVQSGV